MTRGHTIGDWELVEIVRQCRIRELLHIDRKRQQEGRTSSLKESTINIISQFLGVKPRQMTQIVRPYVCQPASVSSAPELAFLRLIRPYHVGYTEAKQQRTELISG